MDESRWNVLDARFSCGRVDCERVVGEEPEGVFGAGLAGDFVVFDPVDGDEDDEGMGGAEVDEEQAARGTEVGDAAIE